MMTGNLAKVDEETTMTGRVENGASAAAGGGITAAVDQQRTIATNLRKKAANGVDGAKSRVGANPRRAAVASRVGESILRPKTTRRHRHPHLTKALSEVPQRRS